MWVKVVSKTGQRLGLAMRDVDQVTGGLNCFWLLLLRGRPLLLALPLLLPPSLLLPLLLLLLLLALAVALQMELLWYTAKRPWQRAAGSLALHAAARGAGRRAPFQQCITHNGFL